MSGVSGIGCLRINPPKNLTVSVLHTNDTHSRILPFPKNSGKYSGKGGIPRRAALVRGLKKENPDTILVDAGDVFQGTPYFNFFKGKLDYRLMSHVGYDVGTLGNHDFDAKVDGLLAALPYTRFPLINSNFLYFDSPLENFIKQYHLITTASGAKLGIFGLGVAFTGLVSDKFHPGVRYGDPIKVAKKMVSRLRNQKKVDLLICLSHLGFGDNGIEPGDKSLAEVVPGIDIIVGGHSHLFMEQPAKIVHKPSGWTTIINQVGWAGIKLGQVDFKLQKRKIISVKGKNQSV